MLPDIFFLASRIEPEIPETFAKLGEIYLSQNKFKLADTYFKHAVELESSYVSRVQKFGRRKLL